MVLISVTSWLVVTELTVENSEPDVTGLLVGISELISISGLVIESVVNGSIVSGTALLVGIWSLFDLSTAM